jgi:hypothetical protein
VYAGGMMRSFPQKSSTFRTPEPADLRLIDLSIVILGDSDEHWRYFDGERSFLGRE